MPNHTGRGWFLPGNKGNPHARGRAKRCVERRYLQITVGTVSPEDWRDIVTRAVQDAKAGDHQARSWLSKHLLGDEPLALLELLDEVEELRAMVLEQERQQQAQVNGQQHWEPRHLGGNGNGDGSDEADQGRQGRDHSGGGGNDPGDLGGDWTDPGPVGADRRGGSGLPPLF
jgi:hypothetical protein